MKRVGILVWLALAMLPAAAQATDIGVGPFGGVSTPILNDLSKSGAAFGVRVPVNLLPLVTVEPYFLASSLGDAEETFGGASYTRDGGKVTGFGANVVFPFGPPTFKFTPFVGLGSQKIERDGAEDLSDVAYNFGLGVAISPMPKLTLTGRGEFNMQTTDETSQKFANLTVGASYSVFSVP